MLKEMSTDWNEEYEKEVGAAGKYKIMMMKVTTAFVQGLPKGSYNDRCSGVDNKGGLIYV